MDRTSDHELDVVRVRLVRDAPLYSEKRLASFEDVVELMEEELSSYDREVMCVLNLDSQGRALNMNIASMGTINKSLASPREIFKSSILSNAASILLMHNHPSGDPRPSQEDLNVTGLLVSCGYMLDIHILDHIIIGGMSGEYFSFQKEGLLENLQEKAATETAGNLQREQRLRL